MKALIVLSSILVLSFSANGQDLRLGILAGAHLSSFAKGNPLPGAKLAGIATYEIRRLILSEQLGVTLDRARTSFPQITVRDNNWRYGWIDASTIINYIPVRKSKYEIGLGTGISIRRIIAASTEGNPSLGTFDDRLYDWTYFVPVRMQMSFPLENDRQLLFAIEYQLQLRDMYKPSPYLSSSDFASQVSRLYSIGLCAGYMLRVAK
jgi:hypothetical protein